MINKNWWQKINFIMLGYVFLPTIFIATKTDIAKTKAKAPPIGSFYKAPGSKLSNNIGKGGVIIQTRNGDIYTMARGAGLEVLKSGSKNFIPAPGSQIKDGEGGVIFQAKNGDIYAMGFSSELEVLKNDAKNFVPALGATIKDGQGGTIFQATNGDIYVSGNIGSLQVLKKGAKYFKPVVSSKSGSKVVIFETKNGDLYVMGIHSKRIEVLKKGAQTFTLINDFEINYGGNDGVFFQAQNGDFYVMAMRIGLKVLKKNAKNFTSALGSKITNGKSGTIFQAANGDIYAMGEGTGLEVLKKGAKIFKPAPGSKINNGAVGTIFQTKNGDLYAMATGSKLEVLKSGAKNFKPAPGSKINNGAVGTIFQTKNGDLYVMGRGTGLEVLPKNAETFIPAPGSITTNGYYGTIFQAKDGDLYVMGRGTGLEVLPNNLLKFTKSDETSKNQNDGIINIVNFENAHSKLKYRKTRDAGWINVPANGKITNLVPGTYEFQWFSESGKQYKDKSTNFEKIARKIVIVNSMRIIIPATNPKFYIVDETASGKNDGLITIINAIDNYSKLQYKLENESVWKDVPTNGKITNLTPGTYQFQWKSKEEEYYVKRDSNTISINKKQTVSTKKEYSNKTVILATTIPFSIVAMIAAFLLIKFSKPFKNK